MQFYLINQPLSTDPGLRTGTELRFRGRSQEAPAGEQPLEVRTTRGVAKIGQVCSELIHSVSLSSQSRF